VPTRDDRKVRGLPPIVGNGARTLVLGSMPGVRSLELGQYYANPGNRFWRVAGHLLSFDPRAPYAARVEGMTREGVALWDVLASCRRRGSLDAAIEKGSERANDVAALLEAHPDIELIGLNGGTAARAFQRLVRHRLGGSCRVVALPSTSGANASWTLDRLLKRWADVVHPSRREPSS
jgi:hypoxanthine-DNA glycosylase